MWKVISESTSTVEMDMNDSVQVGLVGGSSAAASARSLLFCMENCVTITSKRDLEELEIMEISTIGKEERDIVPPELHSQLPGFDIENTRKMPETRAPYNFTIQLMEGKELLQFAKPYQPTPAQMEEAKKQIEELE